MIVAGYTSSDDFPTTEGSFNRSINGYSDAFITQLNRDGSELLYSTYLGGGNSDEATALAPDGMEGMVVAGWTRSNDFPTTVVAFDTSFNGGDDAFVARLNGDGSELLYSTYLGGWGLDWVNAIAPDGTGGVFLVGWTSSNDLPITEGAFDGSFNGGVGDAFVTRIDADGFTDVEEAVQHSLPTECHLAEPYPNPFNSMTVVRFSVVREILTRLEVHDLAGRRVAVLYEGIPTAGERRVVWDAAEMPAGVYVARLQAGAEIRTAKLVCIK
jgi:hypothetical protein